MMPNESGDLHTGGLPTITPLHLPAVLLARSAPD
jgi:hypothetical protein